MLFLRFLLDLCWDTSALTAAAVVEEEALPAAEAVGVDSLDDDDIVSTAGDGSLSLCGTTRLVKMVAAAAAALEAAAEEEEELTQEVAGGGDMDSSSSFDSSARPASSRSCVSSLCSTGRPLAAGVAALDAVGVAGVAAPSSVASLVDVAFCWFKRKRCQT